MEAWSGWCWTCQRRENQNREEMGSSNQSQEENYQNTLSQDVRVAVASPRLTVGIVQPGGPIIPALRVGGKRIKSSGPAWT